MRSGIRYNMGVLVLAILDMNGYVGMYICGHLQFPLVLTEYIIV